MWNLPNDNRQFGRCRRVSFPLQWSAAVQCFPSSLSLSLSVFICVSIWSVCETVSVILPSPYLPSHRTDRPTVFPSIRRLSNKLIRRAWDSSSNRSGCSGRLINSMCRPCWPCRRWHRSYGFSHWPWQAPLTLYISCQLAVWIAFLLV